MFKHAAAHETSHAQRSNYFNGRILQSTIASYVARIVS
jgi:hypothetical protein